MLRKITNVPFGEAAGHIARFGQCLLRADPRESQIDNQSNSIGSCPEPLATYSIFRLIIHCSTRRLMTSGLLGFARRPQEPWHGRRYGSRPSRKCWGIARSSTSMRQKSWDLRKSTIGFPLGLSDLFEEAFHLLEAYRGNLALMDLQNSI